MIITVKQLINKLLALPMDCRVKFAVCDEDRPIMVKSSGDTDIQIANPNDGWGGHSDEVMIYITGCYEDPDDETLL